MVQDSRSSKLRNLLGILFHSPGEFCERLSTIMGTRLRRERITEGRYQIAERGDALKAISQALTVDLEVFTQETALQEIQNHVSRSISELSQGAPFGHFHNADISFARLCYVLVRVLRPEHVVETGVCYGVTSSFLLQGLKMNGRGQLHSIDLPPLGTDANKYVGRVIPEMLRERWTLHRGTSRRLLKPILNDLSCIGMFVHDSLHTYSNMQFEFQAVKPYLTQPSAILADDVEANSAFLEFSATANVRYSAVLGEQDKSGLMGVILV